MLRHGRVSWPRSSRRPGHSACPFAASWRLSACSITKFDVQRDTRRGLHGLPDQGRGNFRPASHGKTGWERQMDLVPLHRGDADRPDPGLEVLLADLFLNDFNCFFPEYVQFSQPYAQFYPHLWTATEQYRLFPVEEQPHQTVQLLPGGITDLDGSRLFPGADLNGREQLGGELPLQIRQIGILTRGLLSGPAPFSDSGSAVPYPGRSAPSAG